ncbi:MAG: HD family phosphohydrolase [Clostridia bacterium]|nr:HD family phosphohydrolase [Clostridia bacterium]
MDEKYVNDKEFYSIVEDLLNNDTVQEMKKYRHHFETSCYDHCLCVSYYAYKMAKKWNADYTSAARAGILHDLFLYDWRKPRPDGKGLHAFRHPRVALNNAMKEFPLNKVEQDAILKHMWPLTVVLPKYKVSYIITLADKYATFLDNVHHLKRK